MKSTTSMYLIIAALFISLLVLPALSQRSEHVCNKTQTESAGTSGSIALRGNCELTLKLLLNCSAIGEDGCPSFANTSSTVNIAGISDAKCTTDEGLEVMFNGQQYCADGSDTGTLVELTANKTLVITAMHEVPSKIFFYHGEKILIPV